MTEPSQSILVPSPGARAQVVYPPTLHAALIINGLLVLPGFFVDATALIRITAAAAIVTTVVAVLLMMRREPAPPRGRLTTGFGEVSTSSSRRSA